MFEHPRAVFDRSALGVACGVVEAGDARVDHRARAHRAGFERDVEVASTQPVVAQGLRRLPLADSAGLRETVEGAIRFGFAVLHSRDGLYLELVRNWHRLPTNRVADALQQHFMELSRLYFIKHYRDYPIEDLQVRVFIVANSVLFTMVRHASQNDALLREDDIAAGLTDMVVGYMTH